tara:strand:- start:1496 stop:1906 length:411 start_codon:yes stop_codon:yes gene_type:complete
MTYKDLLEEIRNKDNIEVSSAIQFNRTYQKQIKDFISSIDEFNRTKDTETLKYGLTKLMRLVEVIFDDNMKRDYDMKLTLKKKDFVIDRLKKYISSYEELEDELPDEPEKGSDKKDPLSNLDPSPAELQRIQKMIN